MAAEIHANVEAIDDDARAAFNDLVRTLRSIGETSASLVTPSATYTDADVADLADADADADPDGEELQP